MAFDGEIFMTEKWSKWQPLQELAPHYYIDDIHDTMEGFAIILSEEKNREAKIRIFFADSVDAYRSTYNSFRYKLIDDIDKQYGSEFYTKWTFFKIERSEYINWLSEQSYEFSDGISPIHFCLIALDSVVDVIAAYEPKVEILK